MNADTTTLFNQVGLFLGLIGSVLLGFSSRVGVISKGGGVSFEGLDPMDSVEQNEKRVRRSHWRNRYLAPAGWCMLVGSFLLQFLATVN